MPIRKANLLRTKIDLLLDFLSSYFAPPNKSGMMNAPNEGTNTKIEPAIIPGFVKGIITLQNVLIGVAPGPCCIQIIPVKFSIEAYSGSIIKGK